MTDPISDMLTRIRNASMTRAKSVELPMSKMKYAIAKILQKEGHLSAVDTFQDGAKPMLRVVLTYRPEGDSTISSIKRMSKPSRRVYLKADQLKSIRSGFGCAILSTPNGLMTNKEAHKRRLGGELICEIY